MSWRRVYRFFDRRRADLDHEEEFRCHLEIEIEENLGRGMAPQEARAAAHRRFGNSTRIREDVYTMNSIGFVETLARDLRYAVRMLGRNAAFSGTAILCLALGTGATTAIFSVVDAVLLRPLPYANAGRLARIYTSGSQKADPNATKFWFSGPEYLALQREARSFDSIGAWVIGGANVTGGRQPVRPVVANLAGDLMRSLGVAPLRGRLLTREDGGPTAPRVAVISYGLWQRLFGGDPAVLNRDVLFSGRKTTIVGIMPRGFEFPPGEAEPPDVWTALQLDPAQPGAVYSHYLSVTGTLKPGVSLVSANREMDAMVRRLERETPGNHFGVTALRHRVSVFSFQEEVVGGARRGLLVLLVGVAFVLLIACVNVASLLLARAETRRREIAIRKAIGAGLATLVRQFITEGVLLSIAGAILGLGIAYGGVRLLTATQSGNIPRLAEIGINLPALLFTLCLSFVTGVAFGLAPIAQLAAGNLYTTLKSGSSRTTSTISALRFRHALVVGELALALVLLIGTGLMVRAFWNLQQVDLGMNPHDLLTLTTTLPGGIYPRGERVAQFWADLQQTVAVLPGVKAVSMMSGLPPLRRVDSNTTPIEGYRPAADRDSIEVDFYQTVGPRFFETMGVRLLEGRLFDERDGPGTPLAVIINQSLARKVWGGTSALGHRMQVDGGPAWSTIVGVVADVKNRGMDQPAGTELFMPMQQVGGGRLRAGYLVVRMNGSTSGIVAPVRDAIRSLDASLPVSKVRDMEDVVASVQSRPRLLTMLLSAFAVLALVLATIGIYGVIAYSVAQRTSEFGIRIAMGASSGDVLRVVLRQGLLLATAGLVLGTIGAFALTRFLNGVLFGITAVDPVTFGTMALVLAGATVLACYVPARRATRVNPTVALRYE